MKKKHFAKRVLCIALSAVLAASSAIGGINSGKKQSSNVVYAQDDTMAAIEDFTKAAEDIFKDVSELSTLETVLTRFSGVLSIGDGCIGILQMVGLIDDPYMVALKNILSEVKNVEDKLVEMDQKLTEIYDFLLKCEIQGIIDKRAAAANDMLTKWQNFKTNYAEPLDKHTKEYQGYLDQAIQDWWKTDNHDGLRRLVTKDSEGTSAVNYTKLSYDKGVPDKADNGEEVLKDECIGLPVEYMPKTSDQAFDINTYKDTLKTLLKTQIIAAANDSKLDASDAFKTEWATLSDDQKSEKADTYAGDLVNELLYRVACETMSNQHVWVNDVISDYQHYCSNLLDVKNGIDAILNVEYSTHGFEGEIKDEINELCDRMIVQAGYFGIFAISVAGQDSLQTADDKKTLTDLWVDTNLKLTDKKQAALTGYDDFCYIIGGRLSFDSYKAESSVTYKYRNFKSGSKKQFWEDNSSEGWKITDASGAESDPNNGILDTASAASLYYQYQSDINGTEKSDESFAKYLASNGVNISEDYSGLLTTRCTGVSGFSLSDALPMTGIRVYGNGSKSGQGTPYFNIDGTVNINQGNSGDVDNDYFIIHDKIQYDFLNTANGSYAADQILAGRAAYNEHHGGWLVDEGYIFYMNCDVSTDSYVYDTGALNSDYICYTATITKNFNRLKITPLNESGNAIPDGPLNSIVDEETGLPIYQANVAPTQSVSQLHDDLYEAANQEVGQADWESYAKNSVVIYSSKNEIDTSRMEDNINYGIERAKKEGVTVKLSDTDKSKLIDQMKDAIIAEQKELQSNHSVQYRDTFGINDTETEAKLAQAVLPDYYRKSDGSLLIDVKNIDTMIRYEANAIPYFRMEDGKQVTQIDPSYNAVPLLVIYDPLTKEFNSYEISDDVMKSMHLKLNLRFPGIIDDGMTVKTVNHYEDSKELQLHDTHDANQKGEGKNRFIELQTGSCSPFEIVVEKISNSEKDKSNSTDDMTPSKAVGTGDSFNMTYLVVVMGLAACAIIVLVVMKKKKSKKNIK